jgi:hypothetical protein
VRGYFDFEVARGASIGEVPAPGVPGEGIDGVEEDLVVHLVDPVEERQGGDTYAA